MRSIWFWIRRRREPHYEVRCEMDFEEFSTTTGYRHCKGCGAIFPGVRHTINCPNKAKDTRRWPARV